MTDLHYFLLVQKALGELISLDELQTLMRARAGFTAKYLEARREALTSGLIENNGMGMNLTEKGKKVLQMVLELQ